MLKLLFPFLFFPVLVLSQQPKQASILNFSSYAYQLAVTKQENLMIVTRLGEIAMSDSLSGWWRMTSAADGAEPKALYKATLDNVDFFNKDTGFVSGFIKNSDKYNIIYRTTDNGKTWAPVDFGQSGWVDHTSSHDNGKAWMSVSGSGIAFTEDYGLHWRKINIPGDRQRFTQIFFNKAEEGIIGSLTNKLAYTNNNGGYWSIIPTPLDQRKYTKTSKSARPEIDKVSIYKNYFIVSQEGLVFYTKQDSIDWKWLKQYSDFYTDADNSALYFKTKQGYIKSYEQLYSGLPFIVKERGYTAVCRNGKLFVMCGDRIIRLGNISHTETGFLYSKDSLNQEIEYVGSGKKRYYGQLENHIYYKKELEDDWIFLSDLPFAVDRGLVNMIKEDILLYTPAGDSLFYFNVATKKCKAKSKSAIITNFSNTEIKRIIFGKGSSGCFHHYDNELVFEKKGSLFVLDEKVSDNKEKYMQLPDNITAISTQTINDFVKRMPVVISDFSTINELGFTKKELLQCKEDINDFRNYVTKENIERKTAFQFNVNNLDFDLLLSLVDSVYTIDSVTLNEVLFKLSNNSSTTTNRTYIKLINKMGEELIIHSFYNEPNSFYFPWHFSIDGYSTFNTSIGVNNFLNKVYPDFLIDKKRVEVLHEIVKKLYEKALDNPS